jgi:hypothetical protein
MRWYQFRERKDWKGALREPSISKEKSIKNIGP